MSDESQQVGSSLLSIEANVIIAGLQGIALVWIFCTVWNNTTTIFPNNFGSAWSGGEYVLYGTYAVLTIVIVGFAVEGLAGILERRIVSRWKCYIETIIPKKSQQYIWKSDQAHKDFSRRRLRILVTRNTAFFFFILTLGLVIIFAVKSQFFEVVAALVGGILLSILFSHLWIDARKGLKDDIESIGR